MFPQLRRCTTRPSLFRIRQPSQLHHLRSRPRHHRPASTTSKPDNASSPKSERASFLSKPPPGTLLNSVFNGIFYGTILILSGHVFFDYFYVAAACEGISMLPSFNSMGDWIVISRYYRRGRGVAVGDVVSFTHPVEGATKAVKRVLGMPGDFVCRDTPGIGQKMIQVPKGHCWVVGDNLAHSRDSRLFGPLPLALIRGKVVWRMQTSPKWLWPERIRSTMLDLDEDDVD